MALLTPSRHIVANKASTSSDSSIFSRIAAASATLGNNAGEIWVYPEAELHTFDQPIVIQSNHHLRIFGGRWKQTPALVADGVGNKIYMHDFSKLSGNGFNTIIEEADILPANLQSQGQEGLGALSLVTPFNARRDQTNTYGSREFSIATYNLEISHLQFKGSQANGINQNAPALDIWNCHNAEVHHCLFYGLNGYAAAMGVYAGGNNDAGALIARSLGQQFGHNQHLHHCLFQYLPSQNVSGNNVEGCSIDHNVFEKFHKLPNTVLNAVSNGNGTTTLTFIEPHSCDSYNLVGHGGNPPRGIPLVVRKLKGGTWDSFPTNCHVVSIPTRNSLIVDVDSHLFGSFTYDSVFPGECITDFNQGAVIDIEADGGSSVACSWAGLHINNNFIDFRDTVEIMTGIAIQGVLNGMYGTAGSISNNTLIGADPATSLGRMDDGIVINDDNGNAQSAAKYFQVSNNVVYRAYRRCMSISGDHIHVSDNILVDGGHDGNAVLEATHLTNSRIIANTIDNTTTPLGRPYVKESFINHGNLWENNLIGSTSTVGSPALDHAIGSTVTNSIYRGNTIIGANFSGGTISESANSNNNIFDENLTGGDITLVGASSKIITHKKTDGTYVNGHGSPFQVITYPAAAPDIWPNDFTNKVYAITPLGLGKMQVKIGTGAWSDYDDSNTTVRQIDVTDVNRAAGYYQFKVKAAENQYAESPAALSPAFTAGNTENPIARVSIGDTVGKSGWFPDGGVRGAYTVFPSVIDTSQLTAPIPPQSVLQSYGGAGAYAGYTITGLDSTKQHRVRAIFIGDRIPDISINGTVVATALPMNGQFIATEFKTTVAAGVTQILLEMTQNVGAYDHPEPVAYEVIELN